MPPPREGDLALEVLAQQARPLLLDGVCVYLKWTCPSCGERVASDQPLTLHQGLVAFPKAMLHTTKEDGGLCGVSVRTEQWRFGFWVAFVLRRDVGGML